MPSLITKLKEKYPYLDVTNTGEQITSYNFSSATKSEIFIKASIEKAQKCAICCGLIHMNSISIDHQVRKSEGGLGNPENGQLTHPFCNTTIKN
jgi:hypothetical protein